MYENSGKYETFLLHLHSKKYQSTETINTPLYQVTTIIQHHTHYSFEVESKMTNTTNFSSLKDIKQLYSLPTLQDDKYTDIIMAIKRDR